MATKEQRKKPYVIILLIFLLGAILAFAFMAMEFKDFNFRPKIAVIPIYGEIGASDSANPTEIIKFLDKAEKDSSVKAIILDINSPGGTVVASKQIADAVKSVKKPTVALIRDVGASGAFWIATAAKKIVADPMSITGSIGVSASYLSFEKLMEKYGITYNRLVTGEYKDIGSPYKELSPKEKEMLQQKINFVKEQFVSEIAQNRNLSRDFVENLSNGNIWLGIEAKKYGLVDVLGGENEAKKIAEALANITNASLIRYEHEKSLTELLTGSESSFAYWFGKGFGSEFLKIQQSLNIKS
ncbi:MAG: signal peptide peptidase SppA [Candidatus Nanoarchaeia archaeon]